MNLYAYAGNNPIAFSDPFGLSPDGGVAEAGVGVYIGGLFVLTAVTAVLKGDDLRTAVNAGASAAAGAWSSFTTWARKKTDRLRKEWEAHTGTPWPKTAEGKPYEADHDTPLADGGADDATTNVTPRPHDDHVQRHKDKGDFKRWGKRGAPKSAEPETPPTTEGGQP